MSAIVALFAICVTGAALLRAAFPDRARSFADRALRTALAAALGLGVWSAGYAAVLLALGPRARVPKDIALALAGAASLFMIRPRPEKQQSDRQAAPRWLWVAFGIAAALAAAVFVHDVLRFPDGGYDAFQTWNLRTRFLARGGEGFRAAFSPQLQHWAHADYPWLVPGLVAQGLLLSGGEPQLVSVAVAAAFAVLAVAIPTFALASLRGMRWGLLAAIALLTTPCFAVFAAHQEADIPLGVYLATTATLLMLAEEHGGDPAPLLALAGLSAGLAAWTKNEGLVYVLCFAAAVLLQRRSLRFAAWFFAGALPSLLLLACFKVAFAPPTDLRSSTLGELASRVVDLHRWGELAVLSARRIVYFQDFALWVVAAIVLVVATLRRWVRSTPATGLLLSFAAYGPIYVLQPYPLAWLYPHSVERIFIQLWPAAMLVIVLLLSDACRDVAPSHGMEQRGAP